MDIQQELLNRITSTPGLMGGKPTIRGLRFPVTDVLELLASGMTTESILEQHPMLEKEDVHAAILYALVRIKDSIIIHAA